MPKYKDYYKLMIEQNSKLFSDFKVAHDDLQEVIDGQSGGNDPKKAKSRLGKSAEKVARKKFNEVGRDAVDVIRDWERRLCSAMGKGQFSDYAHKLSDKFWGEVRKTYPLVDEVGVRGYTRFVAK